MAKTTMELSEDPALFGERREGEKITAFTMRRLRNELIEQIVAELLYQGHGPAADVVRRMKDL